MDSRTGLRQTLLDDLQASLSAAAGTLRALTDDRESDQEAMWWTARHATETALGMLTAAEATPGAPRLAVLRETLGVARAAVESGKSAIYQVSGSRLSDTAVDPRTGVTTVAR